MLLNPSLPPQPCYKNKTEHNKIPQLRPSQERKVAPTKTRRKHETQHLCIFIQKLPRPRGQAVTACQQGDRGPRAFGGSRQRSLLATSFGLYCRNGVGRVPSRLSRTPRPTLKFRSLAGRAFGWERCRRLLSSRDRGTQGDGRDPNSCSHPPCPREGSRPRGCPSPKRVHGQEPACLHSQGVKPHGNRCQQKAEHEDPSHERHLGEDAELGLPPGRLRGSRV